MADHVLEQIMQETTLLGAWLLLLCPLFVFLAYYCWFTGKQRPAAANHGGRRLPPSPPALPIVGHLHMVGSLLHVSLRRLAREHGPDVMLLRLGAVPTLVVSSPRAAEDVLRTNDHLLASRPRSTVTDILMYGSSDVGFAPYGEHWRKARKIVTTHLLSVKKVSMVMDKISEAVATGATVDMSELLDSFMIDMACRIVSGKFFQEEGRNMFWDLINNTLQLLGGFNMEDYFPSLARVGVLRRTVYAKTERVRNRWADLLDKVIYDHESKGTSLSDDKDGDFVDVLLSIRHEYDLTREHMKAILTDVFLGAIDTSSNTLEFTFAELMRRPPLIRKLQVEARSVVPQGQQTVSEIDLNSMTYLRAVIKESLRLHPVAPLLAPHLAMADCNIDGYMVHAGTRVLVNAWAIGRDSNHWEDAEEFIPERFIDGGNVAHVNFNRNDFQFLAFGAGRRMCPGLSFAMANVELMLANLMYHFDWELPLGLDRNDIDMTEVFGLAVRRKEKLLLVPKSHSYPRSGMYVSSRMV